MMHVNLNDLNKVCLLDDERECAEATEALISTAMTLARQSPALAFRLLIEAVSAFCDQADAPVDLLQHALIKLGLQLEDAAIEAGRAVALPDYPSWLESGVLDRIPAHDPTGSPVYAVEEAACCSRKQWGDGEHDADCRGPRYEAERAAEPDPRDDDMEAAGLDVEIGSQP